MLSDIVIVFPESDENLLQHMLQVVSSSVSSTNIIQCFSLSAARPTSTSPAWDFARAIDSRVVSPDTHYPLGAKRGDEDEERNERSRGAVRKRTGGRGGAWRLCLPRAFC